MSDEEAKVDDRPTYGPPAPLQRLTPEELEQRAIEIVRGEWFVPRDEYELTTSFLILHFLNSWTLPANAGTVMERFDKAGPMSVNGLPSFLSCQFVAQEDLRPLFTLVGQKSVALGTMTQAQNDAAWWSQPGEDSDGKVQGQDA